MEWSGPRKVTTSDSKGIATGFDADLQGVKALLQHVCSVSRQAMAQLEQLDKNVQQREADRTGLENRSMEETEDLTTSLTDDQIIVPNSQPEL